MNDVNSALEKIVVLDRAATKLDRDVVRHHSNFGEFYYKITFGKPNPVTAQRLVSDISKLKTRVKIEEKKQKTKNSRDADYQDLFLDNIYRALSAQIVFVDYFFNPESNIGIYNFLHHFFEQPYGLVLKKVKNKKYYEEDNTKQRLGKFFSDYEYSSKEEDALKISQSTLPEIKKFLVSFAIKRDLIEKEVDFDIVLEREEETSSWHENVLSLDAGTFRYTRNNGKIRLHIAKALRDASHEIGHGIHERNSLSLPGSAIPCGNNEYGLVYKVLGEGIADYVESKVISYLKRNRNKIEISVPDFAAKRLHTLKRTFGDTEQKNEQHYIKLEKDDIAYIDLEYRVAPFWNSLDFIEHTNEMAKILSETRQKTARQTGNFCLVRDIWHSRNHKYTDVLWDEMPVVFGGPYIRKTITSIVRDYKIPARLAERVCMIGAWSTRVHRSFVELLLKEMGYTKTEAKTTLAQQTI